MTEHFDLQSLRPKRTLKALRLSGVRASLLDESRARLVAEAVVADGPVGLPRRPVVELQGEEE